ncbi:MAG: BCAM0308 family protein [Nitrospiraceae bacterium]
MVGRTKRPAGRAPRGDRRIQEDHRDMYKARGKLKDSTACRECGATFHKGRWTWEPKAIKARETLCPACHRIKDHCPQGLVTLKGQFFNEHREEIFGLIRNEEAKAKAEHPLSRLMKIEQQDDATVISTTDTHLPRRIGDALHHAYKGEFNFHYDAGEEFTQAFWTR